MIATMGTGYDNIDVAAAKERKIPVTFAPGILDETTADGAFALLLAAARRLGEAERFLRAGKFHGWTPSLFLGHDVHHAVLGVVGMGRIGRAVSRRAKGFAMRILYTDARRNEDAERELGALFVTFDELLRDADFVSVHVPLMAETRHLIGQEWASLHRSLVESYRPAADASWADLGLENSYVWRQLPHHRTSRGGGETLR